MSTEEQLVSLFAYSFFIFPVTSYLVSPSRPYKRWQGALYAIVFLLVISVAHMAYENRAKGPNHFQILEIPRDASDTKLKQKYRQLSLKLHPDKNKAPTAPADFQRVAYAYDVLQDTEKRKVYEKLGDAGVKMYAHSAIDNKYIITQMIVYFASSALFAFLMTFSDPTGSAMTLSIFGLLVILLVESLLILEEVKIPVWLLQYHTSHEVVSTLHRLFPAFMNGCRCIVSAFDVDRKANRLQALNNLIDVTKRVSLMTASIVQDVLGTHNCEIATITEQGVMAVALKTKEKTNVDSFSIIQDRASLINDQKRLRLHQRREDGSRWEWLRNIVIFVVARYIFANSIHSFQTSEA